MPGITTQTSTVFTGLPGHSYKFYVIATDNVGNTQPTPASAQATTAVAADAASQVAVSIEPPAKVTAGVGFSVTVKAEQANGQVDADYNGPITLELNGSARLTGPTTVVASAGVATFSGLMIDTAGSGYTLQAGAGGLTSVSTSSFSVVAGAVTHLAVMTQPPSSVTANSTFSLAIAAEDAFGNVVGSYTKPVVLTLAGGGKLIGSASAKSMTGVATFSGLTINTAGVYTLKAVSGSLAATTNSFSVIAGAATHLVVTTQPPANVTSGVGFSVTVSAEDAFGNIDPTFTRTVALTLSGSGTLSGTASVTASSGVAAFSGLSISTAASGDFLQASASGLTSANSSKLNVMAGSSDLLMVTTEPSMSVTAGSGFTVVVKAENGGMVDTHFSGTISLSLNGLAQLAGPTSVKAKAGVASFTGLSIATAGTGYTLQASAAGLIPEPTTAFAVTAGSVKRLVVITQPPASVTAGTDFRLTIAAEDAFGNVNPSFHGTINLALSGNPTKTHLNGSSTATAGDGVATFNGLTINQAAGGYALSASSGLMSATTGSLTVLAGTATHLVFSSQPSANVQAGGGFAVTVKAEDPFGNFDPTFNGTVSLALRNNPGNALLHGPTGVAASNGVAVFTGLTLDTAAVGFTLTASSGSLTPASSKSITIIAGTATQLAVTSQPPASVVKGTVFGFKVSAEDAFGNVATNFTGSVSLTLSGGSGPARLSGPTVATAKSGMVTFSGLTINTAASGYVIKATARGLTATSTDGFDVTF